MTQRPKLRRYLAPLLLLPSSLALQCPCDLLSSSTCQVQVAAVRLAADPAALTLAPTTSAAVNLQLSGGAAGDVFTLASSAGSQSDLNVSAAPSTISTSGSATVTISALPTAQTTGVTLLTITATHGTTTTSTQIAVTLAPAFTAGATGIFSGERGAVLSGSINISRFPGFAAPISISVPNAPSGFVTDLPATVVNGTDVIPFTVVVPQNATLGLYTMRIRLTYESTQHDVVLAGQIVATTLPPDISIGTTPDTVQVEAGQSASSLVSVVRSAPGIGTVVFTVAGLPAGATASFTPAAVNDTTRVTLTTLSTTPAGTYPIALTGTAGTIVKQHTLVLIVTPPSSLTVTASPRQLTISAGSTGAAGVTALPVGNLGPVAFDAPTTPSGFTVNFVPVAQNTATMSVAVAASVVPGIYKIFARATAAPLTAGDTVTVTVPAGNFSISVPPAITIESGATAFVPISISRSGTFIGNAVQIGVPVVPPGGSAWAGPSSTTADTSTLQIIGGNIGVYPVVVIGATGGVARRDTIQVTVTTSATADFFLLPSPKELSLPSGMLTPMQVVVGRTNGHTGTITLDAITDTPGNYVVEFTPPTTNSIGNVTISMQVYASPNISRGPHLLILRGTSGGVTRTALVTLQVF